MPSNHNILNFNSFGQNVINTSRSSSNTQTQNAQQAAKSAIEQLSGIPDRYSDMLQDIEKTIKSIRGAVEENFAADSGNGSVSLTRDEYEKFKALVGKLQQ